MEKEVIKNNFDLFKDGGENTIRWMEGESRLPAWNFKQEPGFKTIGFVGATERY